MHRVTNLRHAFRLQRVITVFRIANQLLARAHRVDDLGQVRGQGNYAIDLLRQTNAAAGFIGDFVSWCLKSLFAGPA